MFNQIRLNTGRFAPIIRKYSHRMICDEDSIVGLGEVDLKVHKTPTKLKTCGAPVAKYGGRHLVTMLPGSGVGPEMTEHVRDIFKTANVPVNFEIIDVVDANGKELNTNDIINQTVTSVQRNGVGIKGNLTDIYLKDDNTVLTPNVVLRNKLDLYVYLVHCKSYPGICSKYPDIDLVLIRQNLEGEYSMLEHESVPGVVKSLNIMTRANIQRFAKWAFEFAAANQRKKVTVVHNSKNLILTDGMFVDVIKEVAECYPDIAFEDIYLNRCCHKLVTKPNTFDVLLMPNLSGQVIANIICGLAGGPGLFSGANFGSNYAVFESALRQTAMELKGANVANPIATLNTSVRMLNYLDLHRHAKLIRDAIDKTLLDDKIWTVDLGGSCGTCEVVCSIKKHIEEDCENYRLF